MHITKVLFGIIILLLLAVNGTSSSAQSFVPYFDPVGNTVVKAGILLPGTTHEINELRSLVRNQNQRISSLADEIAKNHQENARVMAEKSKSVVVVSPTILAGFVSCIISAIAVAFTFAQSRRQRLQNTMLLYEKWDSPEFSTHRKHAWNIWVDLNLNQNQSVVTWLSGETWHMKSEQIDVLIQSEARTAVRVLTSYFVTIGEYIDLGLIDKRVALRLFEGPWMWWEPFFERLRDEVGEAVIRQPRRIPHASYNDQIQKTARIQEMMQRHTKHRLRGKILKETISTHTDSHTGRKVCPGTGVKPNPENHL